MKADDVDDHEEQSLLHEFERIRIFTLHFKGVLGMALDGWHRYNIKAETTNMDYDY